MAISEIKTSPYIEVEIPNSVQIEEEELAERTFSQEVDAILDRQTEVDMDQLLTFRHLSSVAIRYYPRLKSFGEEINIIDAVLRNEPIWIQWAVLKTLIWESEGPTKFGNIFVISPNKLHIHTKNLALPRIEKARAKLDQIILQ